MSRTALVISLSKVLMAISLLAILLLTIAGCSRERADWRSAQAADSPESYQQFIEEHPESSHVATARERVRQLAEEKDWRAAAGVDSLEAYQAFVAQYPAGKWAKEAKVRIEGFRAGSGSAAPPAPDPASATSAAAPAIASSGFGVQLGAFSSAERANEEWTRLKTDAGGLLDGLAPRVVVGESGGKSIYRLQAEVLDEAQARAICGGLKVANKPCVPVIPR